MTAAGGSALPGLGGEEPALAARTPSLFLIGYRGCGKTSVGAILARRLGREFTDTDQAIVEAAGKSIRQCFAEEGEAAFRSRESEALKDIVQRIQAGAKLVVATGGGIVLVPANPAAMRGVGRVVWLRASPLVLRERIAGDPSSGLSRPPLRGQSSLGEIETILGEREPLYRQAADLIIDVDPLSPEEAAERILKAARPAD